MAKRLSDSFHFFMQHTKKDCEKEVALKLMKLRRQQQWE